MKALHTALLLFACAFLSVGCMGYRTSSLYSENVGTVAVPIFDNTTFAHGLEAQLTEAIAKEIERTTPWTIASSNTADTTLTGSITSVELRSLGTTHATGLIQEHAQSMTVEFEWRDNRTGHPILKRNQFRASGAFVPARGAGEPIEVGRRRAIETLARDIVSELRSQW